MKLKKSLATLLTAALTITTAFPACNVFADDVVTDVVKAKDVYVTIVNAGKICYDKDENPITVKKYNVSDKNNNNKIDIDDALITVHEEADFSDGYATTESSWGKSISKLWGIENGGAYGYYVNNVFAMGLDDPLKDGDYLSAFVYKDITAYSDTYTYFDEENVELKHDNATFELTLNKFDYDEAFNMSIVPVNDATITTLEDESITGKTDEDGKISLTFEAGKTYTVVARNDEKNYVPAFCKVTVAAEVITPEIIKVDATDATCTKPGNTAYWYYVQDETTYYFNDAECTESCEKDSWVIPVIEHTWDEGVVTKEPTTDEEGTKLFTCTVCGETKTESIDKLPTPEIIKVDATDATCTKPGNTAYWYYVQDETTYYFNDAECTEPCEKDSWVIPVIEHTWDEGVVTKEPTTDEEGTKLFTCTVCGETKTESIDKLKKDDKKDSTTENRDNKDSKKTDTAKNDTTKNNDATVATAKVGDTFSDKNLTYKITKAASTDGKVAGEVEVSALKNKKAKKITINATVKFNGVTYKVTSIGKKAFAKAKKLKKIIIKSTTIKKVGKNALKRTSKKLVIKVPKKQKKAYKKLFKKAGNKKVKVK